MTPESTTREIVERDKRHHLHPYQVFDSFAEEGALPMASGEGVYLTDTDGKRYVDAVGGLWCTNIGLGREEMAEAIADQVRRLAYSNPFVDMTHQPAADLAARLAELAPGDLDHVFFSTGGSTAIDIAYRLVQYYQGVRGLPEKRHVISRMDAYHGQTYASGSIGGKPGDRIAELEFLENVHHLSSPNIYRYGVVSSPAVGDMDGNGVPDVVIGTGIGASQPSDEPHVIAYQTTGELLFSVDTYLGANFGAMMSGVVLVDIDGDLLPEAVLYSQDGNLYAFNHDGSEVAGFPVNISVPVVDIATTKRPTAASSSWQTRGIESANAGGSRSLHRTRRSCSPPTVSTTPRRRARSTISWRRRGGGS